MKSFLKLVSGLFPIALLLLAPSPAPAVDLWDYYGKNGGRPIEIILPRTEATTVLTAEYYAHPTSVDSSIDRNAAPIGFQHSLGRDKLYSDFGGIRG